MAPKGAKDIHTTAHTRSDLRVVLYREIAVTDQIGSMGGNEIREGSFCYTW
jgi:hypothetical protein